MSWSVPVLAGVALCGGGVGAVVIDLFEQCRQQRDRSDGRPPEAVLIRNLSYVTGDPRSLKAWVFLVGSALYAILGGVTGFMQADVLAAHGAGVETHKAKGPLLVLYPIIIGVSGAMLVLGVRIFPYETHRKAGTALHVAMAGCFQMFSIIYCFEAVTLATAIFGAEATTTVTRKVFAYVSAVASVVVSEWGIRNGQNSSTNSARQCHWSGSQR
jgi:hypothetical protein